MSEKPVIKDACITAYKGHPILNLPNGAGGFGFGLRKAKMIHDQWANIQEFVESNGKKTLNKRAAIHMWKGKPTLCLNPEEQFKFSFQMPRAVVILEHDEEISRFITSGGQSLDPPV